MDMRFSKQKLHIENSYKLPTGQMSGREILAGNRNANFVENIQNSEEWILAKFGTTQV